MKIIFENLKIALALRVLFFVKLLKIIINILFLNNSLLPLCIQILFHAAKRHKTNFKMAIIAENSSNGSFSKEPVESGVHIATCYSMIHIGTVEELVMGVPKTQNKVRITWEFPHLLKVFKPENGEQPMVISKEFTLSMHEKANLRKTLESWRGKAFTEDEAKSFDITKLLGKSCQINIGHKKSKDGTKTYADILGIMPLPKGTNAPAPINELVEINYDNLTETILNSLPTFITDKMKNAQEYNKWLSNQSVSNVINILTDEVPDDLPF